jgi:hypothetical protein
MQVCVTSTTPLPSSTRCPSTARRSLQHYFWGCCRLFKVSLSVTLADTAERPRIARPNKSARPLAESVAR